MTSAISKSDPKFMGAFTAAQIMGLFISIQSDFTWSETLLGSTFLSLKDVLMFPGILVFSWVARYSAFHSLSSESLYRLVLISAVLFNFMTWKVVAWSFTTLRAYMQEQSDPK